MHTRKGSNVKGHFRKGRWIRAHARGGSLVAERSGATKYNLISQPNADRKQTIQFESSPPAWFPKELDDVCGSSTCPKCGTGVFFIRHNGGCVWLDRLGWPWPKHGCFEYTEPAWMGFFRDAMFKTNPSDCHVPEKLRLCVIGRVVERAPGLVLVALIFGDGQKTCVEVDWVDKIQPKLGFAGVLNISECTLTLLTYQSYVVSQVAVSPSELGLPADWCQTKP